MNTSIDTDILVIGQGLAGSILAIELQKRGLDCYVIGEGGLSKSSLIAAGIWNPIVFKRMTSSWKANEALAAMQPFFSFSEKLLIKKFIHHRKILKYFTQEQEAILWKQKYLAELSNLIDEKIFSPEDLNIEGVCKPEFGFSYVKESGNIETKIFLDATKQFLIAQNKYAEEKFDYSEIEIKNNGFNYKNIFAKKIIFCEGHLNSENKFFNFIPFKPAKGELFIFKSELLNTEHILSKSIFIVPLGNNLYKAGATYNWEDVTDSVTEKSQKELEEKLNKTLTIPYHIIERSAGVRPSVIDRRPVIGNHPLHQNMYVFNGFGTKAVLLAPLFANELINFLVKKSELNSEVNVSRFYKKHEQ